jgi:hypothetical protein
VRDTITRIHDNTSGSARGIKGEDSLDGNIHGRHVEGLKHDLSHLLPVGLGVEGSLSQEDRLLFRGNTELIVEGVMPDLLHIIPVGDDSVFNRVLQGEDTSLGLSFISNIGIFLSHTNHDTLESKMIDIKIGWPIFDNIGSFIHSLFNHYWNVIGGKLVEKLFRSEFKLKVLKVSIFSTKLIFNSTISHQ